MTLALDPDFFDLLTGSYFRLVGERLVSFEHDSQEAARWLYEEAPYCVLAHSTDPDPIFIYGNKTAQKCFGYSWDELTSLRSRLSAEEHNREERQHLLDAVKRHGFATGYRGVRIATRGRGIDFNASERAAERSTVKGRALNGRARTIASTSTMETEPLNAERKGENERTQAGSPCYIVFRSVE